MGINEELQDITHYLYKQQMYGNGDSFDLLNESHGLNDNLYHIALGFSKEIKTEIYNNHKPFVLRLTNHDCAGFEKSLNDLFGQLDFRVSIFYRDIKTSYGGFQYKRDGTIYNSEKQKFDFLKIEGYFYVGEDNYLPTFISMLVHELTHAYDDYNRRKSGGEIWGKAAKDGLGRLGGDLNELYKKLLQAILYQTSTVERNSYIAQILSEIKPYLSNCSSSKEAMECLNSKSVVWKNRIKSVDDNIMMFKGNKDPDKQKWCINYFNHVTKKNISDYNTFLKYIFFRWNKFKKKLISQLGKEITDAAFENPKWKSLPIDNNGEI